MLSQKFQSHLAQVRSLLATITRDWEPFDRGPADAVMDLAESLHQLSRQQEFEHRFRARFREIFDGADEMAGMEDLCQKLAPACAWCMLFVVCDMTQAAIEGG